MFDFEEEFKKLLGDDAESYESDVIDDNISCDSNFLLDSCPKKIYNVDIVSIIDMENLTSEIIDEVISTLRELFSVLSHNYRIRCKLLNKFRIKIYCIKKNNSTGAYSFASTNFFTFPQDSEIFERYILQIKDQCCEKLVQSFSYVLENAFNSEWENNVSENEYKKNIILVFSDNLNDSFYSENKQDITRLIDSQKDKRAYNCYFSTYLFFPEDDWLFEIQMLVGVYLSNIKHLKDDRIYFLDFLVHNLCGDFI